MDDLTEKIYKNSLVVDRLVKLDKQERKEILQKLLENNTERGLAKELNIPHSTLHDWISLRQNNKKEGMHISLSMILKKLKYLKIKTEIELIILKNIKKEVDQKLKTAKIVKT